jgi:hypothetical protein
LSYWWEFGDGANVNVSDSIYNHMYSSRGTYNVTNAVYNQISGKTNATTIIVEEYIVQPSISGNLSVVGDVHILQLAMLSGSDYTCDWKVDDAGPTQNFDTVWSDGMLSAGTINVTFTAEGVYDVTVNCSNHVSSAAATIKVTAQQHIEGLQLEKYGALKNTQFYIKFNWTAGTELITFQFLFNHVVENFTLNRAARSGVSDLMGPYGAGIHNVTLIASNLLGSAQVPSTFVIESAIVDPVVFCNISDPPGVARIATDDYVECSVNMTDGTSVSIVWDYDHDGLTDTFSLPDGVPWTNTPESRTHQYNTSKLHNVHVTVSNNFNSFVFEIEILAIGRVKGLIMVPSTPALFTPPSRVTFAFVMASGFQVPNELSIELDCGDPRENVQSNPFLLSDIFFHEYHDNGTFQAIANVSNPVSYQILTESVRIVERIVDIKVVTVPAAAIPDVQFEVVVTIFRSPSAENVNLTYVFGDGSPDVQRYSRVGKRSY